MTTALGQLEYATSSLEEAIIRVIAESVTIEERKDMAEVLTDYYNIKQVYAALDEVRKKLYHRVDRLEKAVIPAMMDDQGVDKVAVPALKRSFYTLQKHSASMIDKEVGMQWLRDNEMGEAISETVNAGTLAKMLKEFVLEKGIDPPAEAFKLSEYTTIGSSKYTPKG